MPRRVDRAAGPNGRTSNTRREAHRDSKAAPNPNLRASRTRQARRGLERAARTDGCADQPGQPHRDTEPGADPESTYYE